MAAFAVSPRTGKHQDDAQRTWLPHMPGSGLNTWDAVLRYIAILAEFFTMDATVNSAPVSLLFQALGKCQLTTFDRKHLGDEDEGKTGVYVYQFHNLCRRYVADFTTVACLDGNFDSNHHCILYEIQARGNNIGDYLKVDFNTPGVCTAVATADFPATESSAFAQRNAKFPGCWESMDLAGIIEVLASSVAYYSWGGVLDTSIIRAGQQMNITGASTNSGVFIPYTCDYNPAVISVLSAAANACGAAVVTDISGVAEDCTVAGADAAAACVDAINILAGNYVAVGAGSLAMYAMARGVHKIVSVVGHTDEGAIMREVLRAGRFGTPYGVIHTDLGASVVLPKLVSRTQEAAANWTDAVALVTAASIAHCDPCVSYNGAMFPTILTAGPETSPLSTHRPEKQDHIDNGREITYKLYQDMPRFADSWMRALDRILGASGSRTDVGALHLINSARLLMKTGTKYAEYPVVAPYFWIEPTSLIPAGAFGTDAEAAGFGAQATFGQSMSKPFFESIWHHEEFCGGGVYHVRFRSTRTVGLLNHLIGHSQDGLPNLSVRQADPNMFVNPGSSPVSERNVFERMNNLEGFDTWMWQGQSPIPAPSEFMCVDGGMLIAVVHAKLDENSLTFSQNYSLLPHLITNGNVDMSVGKPSGLTPAPHRTRSRLVARQRSGGTVALEQARANVSPAMSSEVLDFIKFTAPS